MEAVTTRNAQILAIDAGGTMTDTFIIDDNGEFVVGKAQSTPEDESIGLLNSARDALTYWNTTVEEEFPKLLAGVYSGTAMLNRLVSRKGRRVGLIVNKGMEDFHRMGRAIQAYLGYSYSDRLHLNTHRYDPPLVPRELTRGVTERVDLFGNVVIPLYEHEVEPAVLDLLEQDVEAIVISLLHSYKYPQHERKIRDIAKEVMKKVGKEVPVFASVDYYPVRKESHRTNTTIIEAYAADPSRETLSKIDNMLRNHGAKFDLRVMASHGGTISTRANELARTLVSGPIGGVVGAKYLGEQLGIRNIACSDIGGTSFDMALITQGDLSINTSPDMARLVLSLPLVSMDTVGAGAGSFVRVDPNFKSLTLGPDSAGSRVGVCYPEGGIETVTVTDCHVVLGLINPDNFLGGEVKLYPERAYEALKKQVADPLGLSVEDAAYGVIDLLESQLRNYLESMILGKGYSPSQYVCFSYGGGGPLHTAGYTKGLGFEDVLVPAWAAGFSAFGCGAADFEYRYDKTLDINVNNGDEDSSKRKAGKELQDAWDELIEKVAAEFEKNNFKRQDVSFRLYFRMQYQGQLNDLEIESPIQKFKDINDWEELVKAFEETYARIYAKAAKSPELGYSITGAIVRGIVEVAKPKIPEEPLSGETPPSEAFLGQRDVYWKGEWIKANIWEMEKLKPGNKIGAFSILESPATTFVIPPGFETYLDEHRIFHLKEL
ncbi:MAG: acetone carboxylase subunit beta [Bacillaceae bacterium]|uniref:hydantoinase/oxoprolinase family protein n=1 Tax=Aeribacillus pallidus TaxID=33936 RepID=UPI000E382744|nr:hydantoinase/oxoprolinase family protein [Aeribacillus pallidus]REJ24507.1 MAG: acetone carboxylase subunit beta [Bacillaceae bacterium]RZI52420.1 hydantoinase/oxoprolinase family protein [Aeribacillus pallidus]